MQSHLYPTGVFNPSLRFAFTNITNEEFRSMWGGVPIVVQPHETIEISYTTPIVGVGHALAVKMANELIDKIMINDIKLDEVSMNIPYARSSKGMLLGVPAARLPFEQQILRVMEAEEESPATQSIRNMVIEELKADMGREQGVPSEPAPSSLEEFSQLKTEAVEKEKPKPVRTKKIKV